jgi:bifunctional non-homologous end joining protein LigD
MCPKKRAPSPPDRLRTYRAKRSAERTPEPFGGAGVAAPGLFVVQKHAARRTHYDLRLEVGGVLKSWAVPKGPSLDPAEKRLAVETEDHPVEYASFEGVIPKGNYGAGAMIVWDRGTWVPLEDFDDGYARGKLLFELRGHKLRGVWTLFRTGKAAGRRSGERPGGREWLLMKKPDGAARPGADDSLPEASILSGLTVDELRDGSDRLAGIGEEAARLGAPRGTPDIGAVDLMLAETADRPFSRAGWLFELKYDGYRLLAGRDGDRTRLRYRNGRDASAVFPEIVEALLALPVRSFLLDGEVVVLDDDARPNFQRLQKRALLERARDAELASYEHPAVFYAFDLLAVEDHDLRRLPLVRRKELLRRLLPPAGPLRFSDHVEERGEKLYESIRELGLEGMVAKDAGSPYVGRRSSHWVKIRLDRVGDFVVVGWSEPQRGRSGFASLHLATFEPVPGEEATLVYAGRVGTGFSDAQLLDVRTVLDEDERPDPPCEGPLPTGGRNRWVEPRLVVEVRFKERTEQGLLRHPVFLRLRTDKTVEDCAPQGGTGAPAEPSAPATTAEQPAPSERPPERTLTLSNLDKVFWPADGSTKGDLIDYYRKIAPFMLPYLADRPIVLTRYPDGIEGKSFFQKNAPEFAPDWIRTVTIWSEGSERDIEYFLCDDAEALVYLANLGTIPIHMWSSSIPRRHPSSTW